MTEACARHCIDGMHALFGGEVQSIFGVSNASQANISVSYRADQKTVLEVIVGVSDIPGYRVSPNPWFRLFWDPRSPVLPRTGLLFCLPETDEGKF